MIKIVKHTYTIYNNPFLLTPLFVEFYKVYEGQEKDFLLAYLILPLVLHENTRATLKNARSSSSIHTFTKKKDNLYGLPQRVQEYKELTNKCMQNAIDNKFLSIDEELRIRVVNDKNDYEPSLKEAIKASANIIKIVKKFDIVAVFRLLGLKTL